MSPLLIGLSVGCMDGGSSVSVPDFDGPSAVVAVRADRITRRTELRTGEASFPQVTDAETRVYLVRVSRGALTAGHTSVDPTRLDELTFVDAPEELSTCELGVLAVDGEHPTTDFGLRDLAEVSEVRDGALVPATSWPAALDQLALRAPTQPCTAAPADVHPFGAASPILKVGDQIGRRTLGGDDLGLTDINFVGYAGPDIAVVGLRHALLAIGRGRGVAEAAVVDLDDPNQNLLTGPGDTTFLLRAAKRRAAEPGGATVFAVVLGHERLEAPVDAGFSVVELTVRDGQFADPRLLYRSPTGRGEAGHFAVGEGEDFLLALANQVLYRRGGEDIFISTGDASLVDVALTNLAEPNLVFNARPLAWLEASRLAPDRLESFPAPRGDSTYDYCGELLWYVEGSERRLFSGCSHPAIFERVSRGWRELPLTFSSELSTCSASVRRCGRVQANFRFQVQHMSPAPDRQLAYVVRGCPALLLAPLEGDRCGRHVDVDVTAYTNRVQEPRLTETDRNGNRILVGGDSGLLVEVELE